MECTDVTRPETYNYTTSHYRAEHGPVLAYNLTLVPTALRRTTEPPGGLYVHDGASDPTAVPGARRLQAQPGAPRDLS